MPSSFREYQKNRDEQIPCGRPRSIEDTIPTTLLHPVFGQFVDDCQNITVTPDEGDFVTRLANVMSKVHDDEYARRVAIFSAFQDHYGIHLVSTKIQKYELDGDNSINGHRYLVVEVKNEMGASKADAYCQAVSYYLEVTRGKAVTFARSVLPCLLLILCGE